jgi:hypothetical protein
LRYSALNYTVQQRHFNNNLTERLLEFATQYGYLFDTQDFTFVSVRNQVRWFYNSFVRLQKERAARMGYAARMAGFRNLPDEENNDRHRREDGSIGHDPSRNGRSLGTPPTTLGLNPGLDNLDRGHRGPASTINPSLSLNHTHYSQFPDANTRALTKPGKDSLDGREAGDDDEPSCRRVSLERHQDQQPLAPETTPQSNDGRSQGRPMHRPVATRARDPIVELGGRIDGPDPPCNYRGARKWDPFAGHECQRSQKNRRRVDVDGVQAVGALSDDGQRRRVTIPAGRIVVDGKNGAEPRAFRDFLRQDQNRSTRRVEDSFPAAVDGAAMNLDDDEWRSRATKSRLVENENRLSQREDSRQRIFVQPSLRATQVSLMPEGGGGSQNSSFASVMTRPAKKSEMANTASDRSMGDEAHSVVAAAAVAIPPGLVGMVVKQCTPVLNQRYDSGGRRRIAQRFLREGRWYHPTDADQPVEWWVDESLRRIHILMQQQALERTNPPKDHPENRGDPSEECVADTTPNKVCSTEGLVNGTQHKSRPALAHSTPTNASLHESRRWDTPTTAFDLDVEVCSHTKSNFGLVGGPCSVSPAPRLTGCRSPFNFFQPPSFPADMVPSPALPVTECPSRTTPS